MGRCMVAVEKESMAMPLIAAPDHFKHLVVDKCVRLVLAVRNEKHITIGARSKVRVTVGVLFFTIGPLQSVSFLLHRC